MSEKLSFPAGASAPSLPMPGLNVPGAGDALLAPPDVHACTRLCRRQLGAEPPGLPAVLRETAGTLQPIEVHGRGAGRPHGERLAAQPELALDPAISCRVLSPGMRNGLFTGRRLAEFIAGPGCGHANAVLFERMLRWALA